MIKPILYQLLQLLNYLHSSNITLYLLDCNTIGIDKEQVQICDFSFASCFAYEANIPIINAAPEVALYQHHICGTATDMWSFGCVILDMLAKKPFWKCTKRSHYLEMICHHVALPNAEQSIHMKFTPHQTSEIFTLRHERVRKSWQEVFTDCDAHLLDLLDRAMVFDPKYRITAQDAMQHAYFADMPKTSNSQTTTTYLHANFETQLQLHAMVLDLIDTLTNVPQVQ